MGKETLFKKTGKPGLRQKNFWLDESGSRFLEDFTHGVKVTSGFYLTKSEVVRVLLDFLKSRELDPGKIESEQDLLDQLRAK